VLQPHEHLEAAEEWLEARWRRRLHSRPKDGHEIKFDIMIPTEDGCVYASYLKHREGAASTTTTALAQVTKMNVKQAHQKFGHCNEDTTRKMAKELGWDLSRGGLGMCESCTTANAKQKNVPQESNHEPASKPNERIYMDLPLIKEKKGMLKPLKPNWLIIVDE
jgi:hypothetical protein